MKKIITLFFLPLFIGILTGCAKEPIVEEEVVVNEITKVFYEEVELLGLVTYVVEQHSRDSIFVTISFSVEEVPDGYSSLRIVSGGNTYAFMRMLSLCSDNGKANGYYSNGRPKHITGINDDGSRRRNISLDLNIAHLRNLRFSMTMHVSLEDAMLENGERKYFSTSYKITKKQQVTTRNGKETISLPLH